MPLPIKVTMIIPDWITRDLVNGTYERVGGVIRDAQTKQIVAWLREVPAGKDLAAMSLQTLITIGSAASS